MSVARSLAPAFTTRHGDRKFRIRPALALVPGWRLSPEAQLRKQETERNPPPTFTRPRPMPPEQRDALDHAVRVAGVELNPDQRQELWQVLALKLLLCDLSQVRNLEAALVTWAKNWLIDDARKETRHRTILEGAREFLAPRDPHPGAYEDALIAWVDGGGTGLQRRKPDPREQDEIAFTAIRAKRTSSHHSTPPRRAGASSS